MRRRSALATGSLIFALVLAGCATPAADQANRPAGTANEPTPTLDPEAAAARAQAEAWNDAANLPPGAVRSETPVGRYLSFTGWPCGPIEELTAYWKIPGMTVSETANWLMENPTADLVTTAIGPYADDPAIDSAIVGYIPEPDSQEGVVYTIAKAKDGVAVRAEIAALTASSTCPELPDGGTWGAPGQG